MRYEIAKEFSSETFEVPLFAAAYFSEAGEKELKVLLYACKNASFDEEEIVQALAESLSASEVREALAFWRGAGLFGRKKGKQAPPSDPSPEKKPLSRAPSHRPNYTAASLAEAVEKSPSFRALLDYAERRLEKNFNGSDIALLYSFTDDLCLGADVVMLAIEHCVTEGKKSLRYTEKLLLDFVDRGVDTYEKAEEYITRRKNYLGFEGKVRAMCGFGTRALTSAEKSILSMWNEEWHVDITLVEAAYERTIKAIGKPSLGYMNKVLAGLRQAGMKNGDDVAACPDHGVGKTYDPEEFFEAAVKRSRRRQKES